VAYPPATRSFIEYVRELLAERCDAVLLADIATQVASIAPTFAAEGAWSAPGGRAPNHAERAVHFLLPSPSWSPQLLSRASRYLQGALVVVPFYGESEAPTTVHFSEAYEERYGLPPETFAAYGYDAYRLISAMLRQGYQSRAALAEALRAGIAIDGVTSIGSFSSERVPARPPPVYEVHGTVLELQP
jgi:ABC-type branched-subunit amino acid transport system substrate-binding protein